MTTHARRLQRCNLHGIDNVYVYRIGVRERDKEKQTAVGINEDELPF